MIDLEKLYLTRLADFTANDPFSKAHGVSKFVQTQIMQEAILDFIKDAMEELKKDLEFLERHMTKLAELSKETLSVAEEVQKMARML